MSILPKKGLLEMILANEAVRRELLGQVIQVFVKRGYIASVDVVNAEKVGDDLLRLLESGQ